MRTTLELDRVAFPGVPSSLVDPRTTEPGHCEGCVLPSMNLYPAGSVYTLLDGLLVRRNPPQYLFVAGDPLVR
jgi:hypothetical protein